MATARSSWRLISAVAGNPALVPPYASGPNPLISRARGTLFVTPLSVRAPPRTYPSPGAALPVDAGRWLRQASLAAVGSAAALGLSGAQLWTLHRVLGA